MGNKATGLCVYCEKKPLEHESFQGESRCVTGRDAAGCPQYQEYLEALDSDKTKGKHSGHRKK